MKQEQAAAALLMVEPVCFGFDPETARTNSFQHDPQNSHMAVAFQARQEFNRFVETLRAHGIRVIVLQDSPDPAKPNAVFPNNWLSTWPDGRIFLYPMATPTRRLERRPEAIDLLKESFTVQDVIDISASEQQGCYLESTGSIVFDHLRKRAYACISPRCDEALLRQHAAHLGYAPIAFHAIDPAGKPLYHTNVLMGVQTTTAVVCLEAIPDVAERRAVQAALQEGGRAVLDIRMGQLESFCGNVLEVQGPDKQRFLVMSAQAWQSFTPEQLEMLSGDKTIVAGDITTIETIGGGGARCMIAEIFLPLM